MLLSKKLKVFSIRVLSKRVNVVACVECCNRAVGRGGDELTDFLRAAVARNENTFARRCAILVCNDIACLVKLHEIFKGFVVWHLSDADKGAFCVNDHLFVRHGVFKTKSFEFVAPDKLFE